MHSQRPISSTSSPRAHPNGSSIDLRRWRVTGSLGIRLFPLLVGCVLAPWAVVHGWEGRAASASGSSGPGETASPAVQVTSSAVSPEPPPTPQAPAVKVTLTLEQSQISLGSRTLLRAFAQVNAGAMSDADQIFSWNVDLLVLDSTVARIDSQGLRREASDRDPATSSEGTPDGADLRGIRDTFLNLPAAGRTEAVELFSVPVETFGSGVARFRVRPGGRGLGFEADFLVLPLGDGPFREGADYANAYVELRVVAEELEPPRLTIRALPGQQARLEMQAPGANAGAYVLEATESLGSSAAWAPVGGGTWEGDRFSVELNLVNAQRFFRARKL